MRSLTDLASSLGTLIPKDGVMAAVVDGVYLTRSSTTDVPRQASNQPVFCVVAQGAKELMVNAQPYRCFPGNYLLCTLGIPMSGKITKASEDAPYLGMSMVLDFAEIAAVMRDAGLSGASDQQRCTAVAVYKMMDDLLDAVGRLADVLQQSEHLPVMAPMIRREIYYRLLMGENQILLRRMVDQNGKTQRVLSGLAWLKENATRNIRMTELADRLHMSTSSMNAWFRNVTDMSPLQFQKQLRLQEARLMMTADDVDVTTASLRVGYESASQFNREYKRFFGAPPYQDVQRLKAGLAR